MLELCLGWMVPFWRYDIVVEWCVYAVVGGACLLVGFSLLWDAIEEFANG